MKKKQTGQGLVEYALLLGLIALIQIMAVTLLGQEIRDTFCNIASELSEWSPDSDSDDDDCGESAVPAGFVTNEFDDDSEAFDTVQDNFDDLEEGVAESRESLAEASDLFREVAYESLEAIGEQADVAAILVALDDGNYEAAAAAMQDFILDGVYVPEEMLLLIITKTMPLNGQICGHLNDAVIQPELRDDLIAALIAYDPDHPAILQIPEIWDQGMQPYNLAVQEYRAGIGSVAGEIIDSMTDTGDPDLVELALEFEGQTEACHMP